MGTRIGWEPGARRIALLLYSALVVTFVLLMVWAASAHASGMAWEFGSTAALCAAAGTYSLTSRRRSATPGSLKIDTPPKLALFAIVLVAWLAVIYVLVDITGGPLAASIEVLVFGTVGVLVLMILGLRLRSQRRPIEGQTHQ